jgi:hypothetical protein
MGKKILMIEIFKRSILAPRWVTSNDDSQDDLGQDSQNFLSQIC